MTTFAYTDIQSKLVSLFLLFLFIVPGPGQISLKFLSPAKVQDLRFERGYIRLPVPSKNPRC